MPTAPDINAPVIEVNLAGISLLHVWRNGRIAWSSDTIRGSLPLQEAIIEVAAVSDAIEAIHGSLLLDVPWVGVVHTGPDAEITTVRVRHGDVIIIDVGSWHERFEADPRLVVTSSGVELLNGRSREAVLAQQPADYRLFRQRWDEVLRRLRSLIPTS